MLRLCNDTAVSRTTCIPFHVFIHLTRNFVLYDLFRYYAHKIVSCFRFFSILALQRYN